MKAFSANFLIVCVVSIHLLLCHMEQVNAGKVAKVPAGKKKAGVVQANKKPAAAPNKRLAGPVVVAKKKPLRAVQGGKKPVMMAVGWRVGIAFWNRVNRLRPKGKYIGARTRIVVVVVKGKSKGGAKGGAKGGTKGNNGGGKVSEGNNSEDTPEDVVPVEDNSGVTDSAANTPAPANTPSPAFTYPPGYEETLLAMAALCLSEDEVSSDDTNKLYKCLTNMTTGDTADFIPEFTKCPDSDSCEPESIAKFQQCIQTLEGVDVPEENVDCMEEGLTDQTLNAIKTKFPTLFS